MTVRQAGVSRASAAEAMVATVLGWLLLASIPAALGRIGLTWDALNHHMYLGWVASESRFDRDLFAASYQSYQYPYLYWPAYQLMRLGAGGVLAGLVQTALAATVVPALWLIANICMPERSWFGAAMRLAAVFLALSGQLALSLMDTTANDVIAASPLVWSVALALWALQRDGRWLSPAAALVLSGLCAGLAVAFKLSNGPLAILMPLLWLQSGATWCQRVGAIARAGLWAALGYLAAYGWWGWNLWREFGNPIYPFYEGWFGAVRELAGWRAP